MSQTFHSFNTQTLQISKDLELSYIEEGQGPETILFVHGLANVSGVWNKNIQVLKQNYRCIALDLPGNGNSSGGDFPYSMIFYAECIEKFLEKLKIDQIVLAGHSMGGQVSVVFALQNRVKISKLILVAPSGLEPFTALEKQLFKNMVAMGQFLYSDQQQLTSTFKDGFYYANSETSDLIEKMKNATSAVQFSDYKTMVIKSMNAMMDEPISPFLSQLECPVLVLFGKNDQLIPNKLFHHYSTADMAEKGVKGISNARLRMVADCGHFLQWDAPKEFNEEVLKFIRG